MLEQLPLTIYYPEVGLNTLIGCIEKFDEDRFLDSMNNLKHIRNTTYINNKRIKISGFINRLEIEYLKLTEISKTFNSTYATDNNKCFESAFVLLKRIKSSIKEAERIFTSFGKRKSRKDKIEELLTNINRTYVDSSYLCSDCYSTSLFGLEVYPPCVQALFNEMLKFFTLLKTCLKLCIEVNNEEKRIKANGDLCLQLFNKFYLETYNQFCHISKCINIDKILAIDNAATASFKNYPDKDSWGRENFHKYSKKDCQVLILQRELQAHSNLTIEELKLFGNDEAKILLYRKIIRNLDKLIPDNYKKKGLSPLHILMLLKYMGCKNLKQGVAYVNSIYLTVENRRFDAVKYVTVHSWTDYYIHHPEEYKKFEQEVNKFVEYLNLGQSQQYFTQPDNIKIEFFDSQNQMSCASHS